MTQDFSASSASPASLAQSGTATEHDAVQSSTDDSEHEFLLFVRGSTPASNAAIHQLRHFCADRFESGRWVLEIIDIQDTPDAARQHEIFVTPAVVMRAGSVTRKIVGDLRSETTVANELRLGMS